MYRNEAEAHVPRMFSRIPAGTTFRTGTSDLKIWRKSTDCCAAPLNGGEIRRFNPQQTVFVLKGK